MQPDIAIHLHSFVSFPTFTTSPMTLFFTRKIMVHYPHYTRRDGQLHYGTHDVK